MTVSRLLRAIARASMSPLVLAVFAPGAEAQSPQSLPPVTVDAPRPRPRSTKAAKSTVLPQPAAPRIVARRAKPSRVAATVSRRPVQSPTPSAAAAPIGPATSAAAAGPTGPAPIGVDPAGGGLTPTGLNLNKTAQSGSRLGLTPFETPASVEIIPGQKARDRGQRTVQEAVSQDATGVTFIGAPGNGGTSLQARGFTGHSSTQQLYDGTRLYVASGTVTFPYDTWSAERIEVLRGPASVLYGEGAIGGVINVVPKKPTSFFTHEAFAATGSDQSRRAAVGSGGPINDVLSYRIDAAGNAARSWLSDGSDYRNYDLAGTLKFQPAPEFWTTITNDHGLQQPLRYFGTPLINGAIDPRLRFTNFNVTDSIIKYHDNFTQLKSEWTPTVALTFRNVAYRLTANRHYKDVESYAYVPATGFVSRTSFIEIYHGEEQIGDRFDATWRLDLPYGWKNEALAGFELNEIHFKHTNNSPYSGTDNVLPFAFNPGLFQNVAGTYTRFTTRTRTAAAFAEDRISIGNLLSVIGGVRFDAPRVERTDFTLASATPSSKQLHAFSYRVGGVVTPIPQLALYAQYATAADLQGNTITLSTAQQQYLLSTGRQIEMGAKTTFWDGRIEATLAFYQIVKNNLLTVDPNRPGITQQVGQQSSRGVEASLAVWALQNLRIEANLAMLRAKYDNYVQSVGGVAVNYAGYVPINVPQKVANVWATWLFLPHWEARAGVQVVGKTYGDNANTSVRKLYEVVNASLDYKPTENVRISARVFNLFDRVYAQSGSATAQILGRPRTGELALNVRW